jgi:hypothetical protein
LHHRGKDIGRIIIELFEDLFPAVCSTFRHRCLEVRPGRFRNAALPVALAHVLQHSISLILHRTLLCSCRVTIPSKAPMCTSCSLALLHLGADCQRLQPCQRVAAQTIGFSTPSQGYYLCTGTAPTLH